MREAPLRHRREHFSRRHGQLGLQFNWIFTVVGGFLFLLFFFILIRSITGQHEEKNIRELSFQVESIVKSAPTNEELFSVAEVAAAEYAFTCTLASGEVTESYLRIDGGDYTDPLMFRHVPLFSPTTLETDELLLSTRVWKAPFPVASLVLLSDNRTQYVIVAAPSDLLKARAFIDGQNLAGYNIAYVGSGALSSVEEEGYEQYRFIYYGTNLQSPPSAFRGKATALVVNFNADRKGGSFRFVNDPAAHPTPDPSSSLFFHGDEMLAAAIFSQDYPSYTCNMAKAAERLEAAKLILQKRLEKLKSDNSLEQSCKALYTQAGEKLNILHHPFSSSVVESGGTIEQLERLNNQLLARSCPRAY